MFIYRCTLNIHMSSGPNYWCIQISLHTSLTMTASCNFTLQVRVTKPPSFATHNISSINESRQRDIKHILSIADTIRLEIMKNGCTQFQSLICSIQLEYAFIVLPKFYLLQMNEKQCQRVHRRWSLIGHPGREYEK